MATISTPGAGSSARQDLLERYARLAIRFRQSSLAGSRRAVGTLSTSEPFKRKEARNPMSEAVTLFGRKHVERYRETDGAVGHIWKRGAKTLLLTTKRRARAPLEAGDPPVAGLRGGVA